MAFIDAARFNALKARVKTECARRCYTGSVASYASTAYDFSVTPSKDKTVSTEHFAKLAQPLNAINSDKVPYTDGKREVSDGEMVKMEAAVALFETRDMTDRTQGDCKSSCTGACYNGCHSSCSDSCSGGCSGGCSGSCRGGCKGGCDNCGNMCSLSCSGTCDNRCDNICTGCTNACTSCTDKCTDACTGACWKNCFMECVNCCMYDG